MPKRAEHALGCRVYATPEGPKGSPTPEILFSSRSGLPPPNPPRTITPVRGHVRTLTSYVLGASGS